MGTDTPRILKSHEVYDYRYKRVIYIVRDPRDVFLSYYYFCLKTGKIKNEYPIESLLDEFVERGISTYGSWQDHSA